MKIEPSTIAQAFEERAARYSDRTFLMDKNGAQWREHSWRQISDAAGRLRGGFAGLGLKRGDRLAILADNCPQWVTVDQAALGLGAVVVPLYTTSGTEEIRHILSDSSARIVAIRGPENRMRVEAVLRGLPAVETLISMDAEAPVTEAPRAGQPRFETLASLSAGAAMRTVEGGREDLATIIYTSGTTGPPKGVMLSHGNILSNCESSLLALSLNDTDIVLSFLPIAHSFERTAGYYAVMVGGGTIAYAEGLSQIAQNLLEIRPTVVLTVPRLLEVIHARVMRTVERGPALKRRLFAAALSVGQRAASCRHRGQPVRPSIAVAMAFYRRLVFKRIRTIFVDRIRYLVSGGAPLPLEVFWLLAAAEVPIVEGYGLTEAAPVVSVNLHGHTRPGTVGLPLSGIEVSTAGDGELLVRGSNVMQGYFGRQEETREAIDAQGWLHTGDIAEIDSEGFIRITDRKKEIIVLSGGKNVSPAYLESRLIRDPYVAQACVVGDRRKHVAALLVPNFENLAPELSRLGLGGREADSLVHEAALRSLFQVRLRNFNRSLSDAEAIVAFTLLATPFSTDNGELTPTLKVRRKTVQEHYREQIEAMYRE